MVSLINKQLLLTAYAYLFIMEQQKAQQGGEALQLQVEEGKPKGQQQQAEEEVAFSRLRAGFWSPVPKSECALEQKFEELHDNFKIFLQKEEEEDGQKEGLAFVIWASLGLQACAKQIRATELAVEIERRAFLHFLRLEKKDTFDKEMEADFDDEFKGFSCTQINVACHHFKGIPTYWAIMVAEFRAAQKKVTEVIPQQQQKADPPGSAIGPIVQLKQFTFYCPDPENNKVHANKQVGENKGPPAGQANLQGSFDELLKAVGEMPAQGNWKPGQVMPPQYTVEWQGAQSDVEKQKVLTNMRDLVGLNGYGSFGPSGLVQKF